MLKMSQIFPTYKNVKLSFIPFNATSNDIQSTSRVGKLQPIVWLSVFANKILLEHCHTHSCIACGFFSTAIAGLSAHDGDHMWPATLKHLLSGSL